MDKRAFIKKMKPAALGASMADLAMLLLVFFMTATSTEPPPGVEVELPKAVTRGADQDSLYLTISNTNELYFDGGPVTIRDFSDSLQMRAAEKDRIVALTADRNLSYADISAVLKILQENGFLNIVFMSEPREAAHSHD